MSAREKLSRCLAVHILDDPPAEAVEELARHLVDCVEVTYGETFLQVPSFDVLVAGRPKRKHLQVSSSLKHLVIPWSGVPNETRELLMEFPSIEIYNLHYNAVPVAEMAVALLLAASKFIIPYDQQLREGDWRPRYEVPRALLLERRTALILGYGHIGRKVGEVCTALGMKVIGIRRFAEGAVNQAGSSPPIYGPEALESLLPDVDVLIVTLPGTEETRGMIGTAEIALLPEDAVLVNVGRGDVIDQEALYRALENKQIAAAGIDVWYNYPEDEDARAYTPPADFPFHELDNVVMSPHRAGSVREREVRRMRFLADLLNAAARGEAMPNRVDLDAGY